MKRKYWLAALLFIKTVIRAQTVALPPFLRGEANSTPGCKNVFVIKDSMLMAVKNKCMVINSL